jgi:two-component system response regulator RegA
MQNYLLVAEDDKVYRERLVRAFRDRGYPTLSAASADEARGLANEYTIKWALIDLLIGADSGLEVLQEILSVHQSATCVILTGYGTIKTAVDAIKLGASQYLTKPADFSTIIHTLKLPEITVTSLDQERPPPTVPTLDQVEWEYIQRVLHNNRGNITQTSKALGVPRRSLQRKLQKYPGKLF